MFISYTVNNHRSIRPTPLASFVRVVDPSSLSLSFPDFVFVRSSLSSRRLNWLVLCFSSASEISSKSPQNQMNFRFLRRSANRTSDFCTFVRIFLDLTSAKGGAELPRCCFLRISSGNISSGVCTNANFLTCQSAICFFGVQQTIPPFCCASEIQYSIFC